MSTLVPELLVHAHAKRLRLPVMANQAVRFAQEAATAGHGPLEFLAALLSAEVAGRDASVERTRIAAAGVEWMASAEDRSDTTREMRVLRGAPVLLRDPPSLELADRFGEQVGDHREQLTHV